MFGVNSTTLPLCKANKHLAEEVVVVVLGAAREAEDEVALLFNQFKSRTNSNILHPSNRLRPRYLEKPFHL